MNEEDMARLWRKLTDNQRLYLMNEAARYSERVHQSNVIVAGRVLDRLGLTGRNGVGNGVGIALANWARSRGYARQDGPEVMAEGWERRMVPSWTFSVPLLTRARPYRS